MPWQASGTGWAQEERLVPTPQDMIDMLLERVDGRIVACNVIAGVEYDVIEARLVAEVFRALARLAEVDGLGASDDPVATLKIVREGDYPSAMGREERPPPMRLRGKGAWTDGGVSDDVTVVFPLSTLRYLVPEEKERELMALGLSLAAEASDPPRPDTHDAVAALRSKPVDWRRVSLRADGTIGRPGELLWFTRREELADAVAEEEETARGQRARDILGLSHRKAGEALVAVHFPSSAVARTSRRPTFIDAAGYLRFMAGPETAAGRADRAWGRTADLRAFEDGLATMDGCPERVAEPVPAGALTGDGLFEFEMLGTVRRATATGDAEDEAFATRLARGQGIDELKAKLAGMVTAGTAK